MVPKDWKVISLGELITISSGESPSLFELKKGGEYPYIKVDDLNNCKKYQISSRNFTDDNRGPIEKGSVIFPKRGAAILSNKVRIAAMPLYMDSNMMSINPDEQELSSEYLFYVILNAKLYKIADTSTIPQINNKHIYPFKIFLPPLPEQRKISIILSTWDVALECTEKVLDAKKKLKQGLMQQLFHKKLPHSIIKTVASQVSVRNDGEKCKRVLSVTNDRGFVLSEEQFNRRVASERLDTYKVIKTGQYAYNPSRINVGSIARLVDWDEGVLSPMYVVFELDDRKVNSDYFLHWLSTHEARERIKRSAQGSVRETVGFQEFSAISMPLPDVKEQNRIAQIVNCVSKEIALLEQHMNLLKTQKTGLMQKLLTGQVRVKV